MSSFDNNPEAIISKFKKMTIETQQLIGKISEINASRDEHRLVLENLNKLPPERKAFRLVGGVLVERTVADVLPIVTQNFDGMKELLDKLDDTLKAKESTRKEFKDKHGIMTQEEREAILRSQGKMPVKQ